MFFIRNKEDFEKFRNLRTTASPGKVLSGFAELDFDELCKKNNCKILTNTSKFILVNKIKDWEFINELFLDEDINYKIPDEFNHYVCENKNLKHSSPYGNLYRIIYSKKILSANGKEMNFKFYIYFKLKFCYTELFERIRNKIELTERVIDRDNFFKYDN